MTRLLCGALIALVACNSGDKSDAHTTDTPDEPGRFGQDDGSATVNPTPEEGDTTHEDTGDGGEDAVETHEDCPEGFTCFVEEALSFTTPAEATQMNWWIQAACDIQWNESEHRDEVVGTCLDLEFYLRKLPDVVDFSTIPDWSLEVAPVDCYDREDDCASGFYGPEEAFVLDESSTGITFEVEAGHYGGPFSCDIHGECDRPVAGSHTYTWRGVICRTELNESSGADVRVGADFLSFRGDANDDTYLGGVRNEWIPLGPMSCVIFE